MRARCITFIPRLPYPNAKATVVLTPSWLGYLFGARTLSIDLYNPEDGKGWRAVATNRELRDLPHGSLILNALDFREVGSPARWALPSGVEAVGL